MVICRARGNWCNHWRQHHGECVQNYESNVASYTHAKWGKNGRDYCYTICFYTECHISSFYLRVGFSKIRKRNVFYNNFKLPSHTYSDNQSPIIPQDVAARLVIQQRAQCVTIFSPFFAPLDMRVTCNITFIILDVRICHLEDKGIFSLHAQSKWNSLLD